VPEKGSVGRNCQHALEGSTDLPIFEEVAQSEFGGRMPSDARETVVRQCSSVNTASVESADASVDVAEEQLFRVEHAANRRDPPAIGLDVHHEDDGSADPTDDRRPAVHVGDLDGGR
jgi:hypothetical protein